MITKTVEQDVMCKELVKVVLIEEVKKCTAVCLEYPYSGSGQNIKHAILNLKKTLIEKTPYADFKFMAINLGYINNVFAK